MSGGFLPIIPLFPHAKSKQLFGDEGRLAKGGRGYLCDGKNAWELFRVQVLNGSRTIQIAFQQLVSSFKSLLHGRHEYEYRE